MELALVTVTLVAACIIFVLWISLKMAEGSAKENRLMAEKVARELAEYTDSTEIRYYREPGMWVTLYKHNQNEGVRIMRAEEE